MDDEKKATIVAATGAIAGSAGAVGTVATAGTITGLSATGITSIKAAVKNNIAINELLTL
ncbi:MAG: hypothetical protein U9N77_04165 [Thermodesulfobacteriota bacterium]|nr:hypothetical protein [Thermodesulfobacteriota bacterium]